PVVWATDIPEPLSTAFELAAFCLFVQRAKNGWKGFVWPLLLFALATFSHESAVLFPALIAAYVFLFDSGASASSALTVQPASIPSGLGRAIVLSAPFAGVALFYLGVRLAVLGQEQLFGFAFRVRTATLVHDKIVPNVTVVHQSVGRILLTLPSILLWYLKLLVEPWLAGPAHPAEFVTAPSLADFYAPIAILSGLGLAGYFVFRNRSRVSLYLFCALWWLVAIAAAPAPGIKLGTDLVFDRYDYLASFAFCLLIADLAERIARQGAL